MIKILIVGQTPPPFHGQAIMIRKLLLGTYENIELVHMPMSFSQDLDEVGKANIYKVFELIKTIGRIYIARIKYNAQIFYYPPAGPNLIPIIRDILILIPTRWMFKKTIFHFHASGLTNLYPKLPAVLKFFFRIAYYFPDGVIQLSEFIARDGAAIKAKKEFLVPYGIEDNFQICHEEENAGKPVNILLVSTLRESKGVTILLEAAKILQDKGVLFHISLMGKFISKEYEQEIYKFIQVNELDKLVTILGEVTGEDKWKAFASANIFCFPTFYESEAFSVVLVEALSFGLPIVTTKWRGIPSIVEDGNCGFLVPIRNVTEIACKLECLINNGELRNKMGFQSRQRYLEQFSLENYHRNLQAVFEDVANS